MTPADLLAAQLRRDGARPLLTWYDDASGERVELSVATAANWAAKVANLLADEHGLEPGEPVRLRPADHWLTVVAALGAWTGGGCVVLDGPGLAVPEDPAAFMRAVLPQPDALAVPPAGEDTPALRAAHSAHARTWSAGELVEAARAAVAGHGVATGARVLSTLPLDGVDALDAGLLLPLAAGGSVVLVANADPARQVERARVERATHTAGVDVPGLPRLC